MKKMMAALSLCMVLFLFGGFTKDDLLYQRAEVSAFGGKAMYHVQVDDRETLKRLDAVIRAVRNRSSVEAPADAGEKVTILADDGYLVEHITLVSDSVLRIGKTYYPCTAEEAREIRSLLEAPGQTKQAFWRLNDGEEMIAEGFCGAESEDAEALQSIIAALPEKHEFPEHFSTNGEWLLLHLYRGDSPMAYYVTPEWIEVRADYGWYYPSSPELYEKIKQTAGAQNLAFDYPKTLQVDRFGGTEVITDPVRIRAILEPFQNMRPTVIEGGLCGAGMVTLTLDGKESFFVVDMETLLVRSSERGKYYAKPVSHSAWLSELPGAR